MTADDVAEVDLHAFADGELDPARADRVRAHLATHAADAARVESWQSQNAAIRRAFEAGREPMRPAALARDAAIGASPRDLTARDLPRLDHIRNARRRRRAVATLAAFLGGACVASLGAVAIGHWPTPPEAMFALEPAPLAPAAQARRARLAWRTFAREIGRHGERDPIDPAAALASLQRPTALSRIPDWSREAFTLAATRVMPGESEPAAFLMFESPARTRVALIVERTPESDSGPLLSDDGGLRCLFWRNSGYSFAIVGPAESDTLRSLGRLTAAAFAAR